MVSNKKAMLGLATAVLLAFTAQAHAGGASSFEVGVWAPEISASARKAPNDRNPI